MEKNAKIYVAGHTGLVGSAVVKKLREQGYNNIITKTHADLDLTNQAQTEKFFKEEKPEYVFFCAAKMGSFQEQLKRRADFCYINLAMQTNVLHFSYEIGVKKLLYLSSLCIYPQDAPLPLKEESLLTGELQIINEPYSMPKIIGNKMCEFYNDQYGTNFISLVPTSVYGENDNFDLFTAHVFPAVFRKIYLAKLLNEGKMTVLCDDLNVKDIEQAKNILNDFNIDENSISLLGTGRPKREFIYVGDVADACLFVMNNVDVSNLKKISPNFKNTHINLSNDDVYSISDIAHTIKEVIGYKGEIKFSGIGQEGTMLKKTDTTRLKNFGWGASTSLKDGISSMYEWYKKAVNTRI